MSRFKVLISGKIGNIEISTVKSIQDEVTTEYIEDGIKNPQKWGLSSILKGWVISETYNNTSNKWDQTGSVNFQEFLIQHKKKYHKPEADSSLTLIQSSQSKRKSGYCYIGEDRGFRSCIKIDDTPCLSGMIYPTKDHCIHPHLRH